MCGILGRFDVRGHIEGCDRLARLVNLLKHRGPDGGAYWSCGGFFLGHRRLSIIDLSDAGTQPMGSEDGRLVVTFNGEIYNYLELREELRSRGCVFRTSSDTEVLLHGYAEWGTALPEHLVGMFAFGIADRVARTLFLARDRFGEKPLLYSDDLSGVSFASELGPMAALAAERRIDMTGLAGYLCLNYVPGTRTLLDGVRRVVPGTWRLYHADGAIETGRFFDPFAETAPVDFTFDDVLSELERRLDSAVNMALRSDVPVGLFLSGGIDSSLVARSAARAGRVSQAYCLTFAEQGFSEWHRAALTARQVGVPLTRVEMNPRALSEFLSIVDHADDPLADSSSMAVWTLARAAAATSKVVLSGDGGDELFGGYLTYRATAWHRLVTARLPSPVRRALARTALQFPTSETKVSASYKVMRYLRAVDLAPCVAHLTWNGSWLPAQAAQLLTPEYRPKVEASLTDVLGAYPLSHVGQLRELQALDVSEYLPNDILAKSDRMSMAHGLEVRAPLLAPSVAELALALPDRFKCGLGGQGKRVLRELARRRYGIGVASAPKQGFSIPVHQWLREPARELVDDLLAPRSVEALGCLDASAVSHVVREHLTGRRSYGWEIWGLLVLVAWHRARVARAPLVPEEAVARRAIPLAVQSRRTFARK